MNQLISVERIPQNTLRTEQAKLSTVNSAFDSLKTRLLDLKTATDALKTSSTYAGRAATTAEPWSTGAASGTALGRYEIQVSKLASAARRTGASDAGGGIAPTADVSGTTLATLPISTAIAAGEVTINGARITIDPSDSLQDVFDRISTATGGAVTASYNPASDRVELSGTGEIVLGSANDTSNLFRALGLFNNGTSEIVPPSALGVVSLSAAIKNANLRSAVTNVDAAGNGTFAINGVAIAYNVNDDSLQAVLNRINASSAGVTATFDRASDRFILSNKTTGDVGIAVSEGAGGLLDALGLGSGATFSRGANAEFTVDGGGTLTSYSNTLDDTVHGITGLTVTPTAPGSQTVSVASETTGARKLIESFIEKFNSVQQYIADQTKTSTSSTGAVTKATLAGNREVSALSRSLRSAVFDAVPGLSGALTRLEGLGIDFTSGTSKLEIKDSTKLDAALSANSSEVTQLFTASGTGLADRLSELIKKNTDTGGLIENVRDSNTKRSKALDEQIAVLERRLIQQRSVLEAGFIKMEQAQSTLQQQLTALTNAFGSSSPSSK